MEGLGGWDEGGVNVKRNLKRRSCMELLGYVDGRAALVQELWCGVLVDRGVWRRGINGYGEGKEVRA